MRAARYCGKSITRTDKQPPTHATSLRTLTIGYTEEIVGPAKADVLVARLWKQIDATPLCQPAGRRVKQSRIGLTEGRATMSRFSNTPPPPFGLWPLPFEPRNALFDAFWAPPAPKSPGLNLFEATTEQRMARLLAAPKPKTEWVSGYTMPGHYDAWGRWIAPRYVPGYWRSEGF